MALEFTQENFQTDVLEADKPVLVDFWATWCGPCMMQGPIVDKLATDFGDRAHIGKLNVETAPDIASRYGVMAIPTILIFKGGETVERLTGLRQEAELTQILEKHLA